MSAFLRNPIPPQPATVKPDPVQQGDGSSACPPAIELPRRSRIIEVRQSAIHGKGVFACAGIDAGRIVAEYRGDIVTWQQADRRRAARGARTDEDHTFLFQISKRYVIDATGNRCRAKWINHSCAPNCQAVLAGKRVFIETLRRIEPGEELFYDYQLQCTDDADGRFHCRCAAARCRGTLLGAT